jgi:Arc/MetJ-type ribon-helix-helix transcriptional regulator
MRQNMQEQAAKLLQSHEQNRDKVSIGRYKSNSELLGFTLRLQDTEYVDKIQMEGKKARLDNSIAMKEAIQNAVFKDEIDLFQSSIYFKQLLNMDARQFQQALSTMDIDSAMKLASSQNDAANSAMLIQTGSQVLSDAAGLYAKYKSKK